MSEGVVGYRDLTPSHDGQSPFSVELSFSEEFDVSYLVLRDHAFT